MQRQKLHSRRSYNSSLCANLCKENDKSFRLWGHFSLFSWIYFNAVGKSGKQCFCQRITTQPCCYPLSDLSPCRQNAKDKLHRVSTNRRRAMRATAQRRRASAPRISELKKPSFFHVAGISHSVRRIYSFVPRIDLHSECVLQTNFCVRLSNRKTLYSRSRFVEKYECAQCAHMHLVHRFRWSLSNTHTAHYNLRKLDDINFILFNL